MKAHPIASSTRLRLATADCLLAGLLGTAPALVIAASAPPALPTVARPAPTQIDPAPSENDAPPAQDGKAQAGDGDGAGRQPDRTQHRHPSPSSAEGSKPVQAPFGLPSVAMRSSERALAAMSAPVARAASSAEPSFRLGKLENGKLQAINSLDIKRYMGLWYQVALYPNRFQAQCVSDTTAEYQLQDDGSLQVSNRCKTGKGEWDVAIGRAEAVGSVRAGQLSPATLRVSFVPPWLRWMGVGWGSYWVVMLADDHRFAVVSEPSREYLWVLSRTPELSADDERLVRTQLRPLGFDLSRLVRHQHSAVPMQ